MSLLTTRYSDDVYRLLEDMDPLTSEDEDARTLAHYCRRAFKPQLPEKHTWLAYNLCLEEGLTEVIDDVYQLTRKGYVALYLRRDGHTRPTVWHHGDRSYSLDGHDPVVVSRVEHNALSAFQKTATALDTSALSNEVENAARVMRQLAKKFPGAIRLPKKKGEGYFVDVRPR